MLFNSYVFILIFLPVTLVTFFWIVKKGNLKAAIGWLASASLFFYAWWNPIYLSIIAVSILFNYSLGVALKKKKIKSLLSLGVAGNLGLLGYFKYANFFVDNVNAVTGSNFYLEPIVLPLAISFFTFQQIAFLVDTYRGDTCEYTFLHYALFVTFFPQLIAGPIVHHKEMLPQFTGNFYGFKSENIAVGLTIFFLGLFKKVVIADTVATYATPVFQAAEQGYVLTFLEAWEGVAAYTFQIYFDFSGYSDMAIGLAQLFGIRVPLNFHSPYKAANIIDFWRRWHMTLSRFLMNYLYIPLGGNRKGFLRRYINLMTTMLIGGLWHGASWTFVAWGALHGIYLIINHAWRSLINLSGLKFKTNRITVAFSRMLTLVSVAIAWVFFRADTLGGASSILKSMAGFNGFALPKKYLSKFDFIAPTLLEWGMPFADLKYFKGSNEFVFLLALLLLVWLAPNIHQIMGRYAPALDTYRGEISAIPFRWMQWQPALHWAVTFIIITVVSILSLSQASEFLYFQF